MKILFKSCFLFAALLLNTSYSQQSITGSESTEQISNAPINVKSNSSRDLLSKTNFKIETSVSPEKILADFNFMYFRNKFQKEEKYSFNIVSSFGDNIRFGGFWERYAIVNFSPQMSIQPTGFLSLYANHNLSSFIPIEEVKDHFKTFAFQSLTVMAIDNSIKYLFPSQHWIPEVIGFAVKNLVINLFIKPAVKNNNRESIPWIQDESYYYSMSVKF